MTILQLLEQHDDYIRNAAGAGSITKVIDASLRDNTAHELRDRGLLQLTATSELSGVSKDNTRAVIVKDSGIYVAKQTVDAPNGTTTFASADSGWLWELYVATSVPGNAIGGTTTDQDYEYSLNEGSAIDMVKVKPSTAYELAISLTPGGNEISPPFMLVANKWNTFRIDVDAEAGDVSVFFEGVSSSTVFAIYRRAILT